MLIANLAVIFFKYMHGPLSTRISPDGLVDILLNILFKTHAFSNPFTT